MARPRTIDQNIILSAAEDLLTETGGLYFTLDQVAARAGVSKGAVTNTWASKTALVSAMLAREFDRFKQDRAALVREGSKFPLARAHIEASQVVQEKFKNRAAHLVAALAHEQAHLDTIRSLYADVLQELAGDEPTQRKGRMALFAIEGAFLMRGLGMVSMTDKEWLQLFEDALGLMNQ